MPTVRQAVRVVTADGGRLKNIRGSHRQFVHRHKPGKVTVPGKLATRLRRARGRAS